MNVWYAMTHVLIPHHHRCTIAIKLKMSVKEKGSGKCGRQQKEEGNGLLDVSWLVDLMRMKDSFVHDDGR